MIRIALFVLSLLAVILHIAGKIALPWRVMLLLILFILGIAFWRISEKFLPAIWEKVKDILNIILIVLGLIIVIFGIRFIYDRYKNPNESINVTSLETGNVLPNPKPTVKPDNSGGSVDGEGQGVEKEYPNDYCTEKKVGKIKIYCQ